MYFSYLNLLYDCKVWCQHIYKEASPGQRLYL